MSSDAITRRLRKTEQLRKLSISLMKAKPITSAEAEILRENRRLRSLESTNSVVVPK